MSSCFVFQMKTENWTVDAQNTNRTSKQMLQESYHVKQFYLQRLVACALAYKPQQVAHTIISEKYENPTLKTKTVSFLMRARQIDKQESPNEHN